MRFYQYLSEMTLRGELTFGFELEGIFTQKMAYRDMKQYIFDRIWGKDYSIEEDQSIEGFDSDIETPFEFQTHPLNFTPKNIQRSIDFLTKMFTKGDFRTNETCGFHVHFGMPNLDKFDMVWVYINIAMDEDLQNAILKFKDYNFHDFEYADKKILDEIRRLILNKNWEGLSKRLSVEKHRVFRIHPQGTLEWRGPRNFLNKGTADIKDFFKLLYMFVSKIVQYRDAKEIKGYLTVKEFKDIYSGAKIAWDDPANKKRDERFNKGQDLRLLPQIFKIAPWLNKADFGDALITIEKNKIRWEFGRWYKGTWKDGTWKNGRWIDGVWENGNWFNGVWEDGTWKNGNWFDGTWNNGTWVKGNWITGTWNSKKLAPESFFK